MANAFNTQQNGISSSFFSFKIAQYLAASQMAHLNTSLANAHVLVYNVCLVFANDLLFQLIWEVFTVKKINNKWKIIYGVYHDY